MRPTLLLPALAATAVLSLSCAARPALISNEKPLRLLHFENATLDPVRIYLVQGGRSWPVGRAAAGRKVAIPLPPHLAAGMRSEATLVAVPVGTPRGPDGNIDPLHFGVISAPEPFETLLEMRWKLYERRLSSFMPPSQGQRP